MAPATGIHVNGQEITFESGQPFVTISVAAPEGHTTLELCSHGDDLNVRAVQLSVSEEQLASAHAALVQTGDQVNGRGLCLATDCLQDVSVHAHDGMTLQAKSERDLRISRTAVATDGPCIISGRSLELETCFIKADAGLWFKLPHAAGGVLASMQWLPISGDDAGGSGTFFQGTVNLEDGCVHHFLAHKTGGVALTFRNPQLISDMVANNTHLVATKDALMATGLGISVAVSIAAPTLPLVLPVTGLIAWSIFIRELLAEEEKPGHLPAAALDTGAQKAPQPKIVLDKRDAH